MTLGLTLVAAALMLLVLSRTVRRPGRHGRTRDAITIMIAALAAGSASASRPVPVAHPLCFTSLSEANTSTLFEALEAGCIPFALDLDGFSTNITPDIGYLFSITAGWDSAVAAYAAALDAVARADDLRAAHGAAIALQRPHYAWVRLAARHAEIIDGLIDPRQPHPSGTLAS